MNPFVHERMALSGMIILAVALTLSLGGLSLVFYSARMTREAVSRRVDLGPVIN
jgi:hypothetical protein